jgi:hypothetical protein
MSMEGRADSMRDGISVKERMPDPPGGETKKPPHHRGGLARGNAR